MGKVLYECHFQFHFMSLVPFIMFIYAMLFPYMLKYDSQKKGYPLDMKFIKIFSRGMALFVLICGILEVEFIIDAYKKTVVAYRNGDYQIVEGYVENFIPIEEGKSAREHFEVDGVKFQYTDHSLISGYRYPRSHGGVIRGDGQHLKIGYVYYGDENIIVYIEELR